MTIDHSRTLGRKSWTFNAATLRIPLLLLTTTTKGLASAPTIMTAYFDDNMIPDDFPTGLEFSVSGGNY